MLTGVHLLLTYACTFECDHCFLYCSPWSKGTFTLEQIKKVLDQASRMDSVDTIFFEGGEPLLYYSLLLEGVGLAHGAGFKVGLVTNAYPSNSPAGARLWLEPLARAGVDFWSISDDSFHNPGQTDMSPARIAHDTAREMGLDVGSIAIADPSPGPEDQDRCARGAPVEGGQAKFRGRAADKLIAGLTGKDWKKLDTCPDEDFAAPSRVHIDAYGHVHLCQGLIMGNIWEKPLPRLMDEYDVNSHPICSALDQGGPALLAERLGLEHESEYLDECHLCFSLRRQLLDRFQEYMAHRQVYGPKVGS